jgi:membrane associated rhomboid family serine protease
MRQRALPMNIPMRSGNQYTVWTITGICYLTWAATELGRARYDTHPTARNHKPLQTINDHFVLSLRNLRQGRPGVLLTHSLTHFHFTHISINMSTLLSLGPLFTLLYGPQNLIFIWIGFAIASELLDTTYWEMSEKKGVVKEAVGSSDAIAGLSTSIACALPY